MTQATSLEQSYLVLIKFLMVSKRRIMELAADFDLTGIQAMTLFLLDEPKPMNSFKKIYNCDASNVTGIIDGLEEKGLAKRFEHPEDRRIKMVQLTTKGQQRRDALITVSLTAENPLLARLTDAERQTLVQLLAKATSPEN